MASIIFFTGKRREIGCLSVFFHGNILWGITVIVGDPGVHKIDGHAFQRDVGTASCLPYGDKNVGIQGADLFCEQGGSAFKGDGKFQLCDTVLSDSFREQTDRLIGRIDGLAAKRRKTGGQNFHEKNTSFCYRSGNLKGCQ